MQFIRTQFRALCSKTNFLTSTYSDFHTQTCRLFQFKITPFPGRFERQAEYWKKQNETEYDIQKPGDEPRLATINYCKDNIPVSWKNLFYICKLVEGMTVDEALKQLSFVPKKGAYYIKDALKEAQMEAVKEHNVEFKSNLWIATSFAWRERYIFRGIQRKARKGPRKLRNHRSYYYLTLKEGTPPPDFNKQPSGEQLFEDYMRRMRQRKILTSL